MGGAMLEGWLSAGLEGRSVTVIDPLPSEAMTALCKRVGASLNPKEQPAVPEALVLGIKPQMLDAAAPTLAPPPPIHRLNVPSITVLWSRR